MSDKAYAFEIDMGYGKPRKWAVWTPWPRKGNHILRGRYSTESRAARMAYAENLAHMSRTELVRAFGGTL